MKYESNSEIYAEWERENSHHTQLDFHWQAKEHKI